MKEKEKKMLLESVLVQFSPATYPGRIYGMYDWDFDKQKWIINEEFCKEQT